MEGKKIYILRHGRSVANEAGTAQDGTAQLSDIGRAQAEALAERMSRVTFAHVYASVMPRALETARAIERKTGVSLIETQDLVEVMPDAQYVGKKFTDPELQAVWWIKPQSMDEHRGPWGASMSELLQRARRVLTLAESVEGDVVLVTHGAFMTFIVATAIFDTPSLDTMWNFYRFSDRGNTSVTCLRYAWGHWNLNAWNDQTHIG